MRVLVYGAGVIGCLYAALLSESGVDVTVYARGARLESLASQGLRHTQGESIRKAPVKVIGALDPDDSYDYVFLTVKENQVRTALAELSRNVSPTIVTMVNSLDPYETWEDICGAGRILPAFPGAGGGFENDVLHASLTPRLVQPTTFGEISGASTARLTQLAHMFRNARIPYQIVRDMRAWQICHLAMVVPIADAYYEAADPAHAGRDRKLMRTCASRIKTNFKTLRSVGIRLAPAKMNLFAVLPSGLVAPILGRVFESRFGDVFMYRHSMKAPDEMRKLHDGFYAYIEQARTTGKTAE
ncbi:ketopantoate reductase family protein [Slackia heliotrinireducens]|uniref:ketopantoate reductase family protein n=1 Tax=Slackia heliotrinireducens TaxID=84110 RepID=UPI0033155DFF